MQSLQFLAPRERFLPVQQATLLEWVLADPRLGPAERTQFRQWFEMIEARFHYEFHRRLRDLVALYDPFDPDRETVPLADVPADKRPAMQTELSAAFARLLDEGNYAEMAHEQIVTCVELQTGPGLAVDADLDEYSELRVFYRGVRPQQRSRRELLRPWRRIGQEVNVFSRAALLVRLARDPNRVLLKLFKNVVAEDLEMILPQVRIRMRWFDFLTIGSSAAGSVATAAWKVFTAAILSPWVFLAVLFGFGGAGVKALLSFFASRTKYMQRLTSNLYFQNLANNRSALARLVESAEAEEVKEILLAYFKLYTAPGRQCTPEELDRRAEAWLRERLAVEIDFEVGDAVQKLIDKGLVAVHEDSAGRRLLRVDDLPEAIRKLDETWDNFYTAPRLAPVPGEGPHFTRPLVQSG